jgi:type IV pilus assembly protein PilO
MPRTQREQGMVLIGILGLALAGLYYYYVYSPRSVELTATEARVDSLENMNRAAKAQLAAGTVGELQDQLKTYSENLQLMRQLVPESNQVPALLEQVSTAARRAGLEISKFEPIGPESGRDFDAYRYKLGVTGSYHDIAEFLTNVGSLSRIVVPLNVQMNSTGAATTDPRKAVMTTFELHTYVARTTGAQ